MAARMLSGAIHEEVAAPHQDHRGGERQFVSFFPPLQQKIVLNGPFKPIASDDDLQFHYY